jgi:hypothetical protein
MRSLSCIKGFWEIIRGSSPEVFELRKTRSVTKGSLKYYSVEAGYMSLIAQINNHVMLPSYPK